MTNFIYDGTALPNWPKTNLTPIGSGDPLKYIQSTDYNAIAQALVDVQTFCRGGTKLYKTGDATKHADLQVLDGNPSGSLTAEKGSLCLDITNAFLYQNADGATTWNRVGLGQTPAVSIANAVSPATLNVTTEGTIDWVQVPGVFAGPLGAAPPHAKFSGGGWFYGAVANTMAQSTSAPNTLTPAVTSTATDDRAGTALSATKSGMAIFTGAVTTPVGFGFSFRVPAGYGVQRVLRIYGSHFNVIARVNAKLSQSGTTATSTHSVSTVETPWMWTVTFTGGSPGDELLVQFIVDTINSAAGGSLSFLTATLGLV